MMNNFKRKIGHKSGFLSAMVSPTVVDFVAYLTLEECVERLRPYKKHRRKLLDKLSTRNFILKPLDRDCYLLTLPKQDGHPFIIEGYLTRHQSKYTHVYCEFVSDPYFNVSAIGSAVRICLLFIALFFVTPYPLSVMGILLMGGICYAYFMEGVTQTGERYQLAYKLEALLDY